MLGDPPAGHIIRPSDKKHTHKIAWIQCGGKRVDAGTPLLFKGVLHDRGKADHHHQRT